MTDSYVPAFSVPSSVLIGGLSFVESDLGRTGGGWDGSMRPHGLRSDTEPAPIGSK